MRAAFCVAALLLPATVHSAIVINEVAWMGTGNSANDEWIELFNSGASDVTVDEWTLSGSGGLSIPLSGTIASGAHVVLERTDDTSAPGSAFVIYTGALANSGETLTLRRADTSLEDQVAGGEGWESIGGDNATKETAQRTSAGWITAVATPGSANASVTSASESEKETVSSSNTKTITVSTSGGGGSDEKVVHVTALTIHAPQQAYVNQPVEFDVSPSGGGNRLVRYSWNFGDGNASDSKSPLHTYRHPGNYVIMVESYYAKRTVLARREIVVLPATLSLARAQNGDVQINNDAKYEIDISGFRVRGERGFIFPEHTIVLAGATVTLPRGSIEEGLQRIVSLYDPKGGMVAIHSPYSSTVPSSPPVQRTAPLPAPAPTVAGTSTIEANVESDTLSVPETPLVFRVGEEKEDSPRGEENAIVYFSMAGLLLLGTIGVFMRRAG